MRTPDGLPASALLLTVDTRRPSGRARAAVALLGAAVLSAALARGASAQSGPPLAPRSDPSQAVHLIEVVGSTVEAGGQSSTSGGSGTGFVVSPDGLMVTNHHVVAGASIIEVYLPGREYPVNAPVLGYSECHDLAVLDLPLDDLPYLQWSDVQVVAGQPIVVAGYPDGDPRFALIPGSVLRAPGPGATSWASVDLEIEHTAPTRPGSSGGPLLDDSGRIVGVHYAGSDDGRHWAISGLEAQDVVAELAQGHNVASIGLNGEAVSDDEDLPTGIFVASVVPGSSADRAGIEPGDVVTSLNGVALATDGTMETYCSILRSSTSTSTLDVEVVRDGRTLSGQINGTPVPGSGSVASPGPSSGTGGTTAAEADLRTHIPSAILKNGICVTSGEDIFPQDAIASVDCDNPAPAVEHVWYDGFATKADMEAYWRILWDGDVKAGSGSCPNGPGERPWYIDDVPQGRVACWIDDDGWAWMTWTDEELLIVTTALQYPVNWKTFATWWAKKAGPFR